MKFTYYLFTVFFVMLLSGCDQLDNPVIIQNNQYLEGVYGPVPNFSVLDHPLRNVMVEEFSGHLCGFCPPATGLLNGIDEESGDRVVVLNIHAGTLAAVSNPPLQSDYNTEIGNIYWGQLEGGFNPCARINRKGGISNFFIDNQWSAAIDEEKNKTPSVAIQMITEYISEDKNLNVHVHSQFLQNLTGNYNLVVLLTESNIISAQIWYGHEPEVVTDYQHNHLLRTGLTGAQGIPLISDPLVNDQPVKSFTLPIKDAWVPDNCTVVAFIVDNSTGEIINAVESHISE